MLCLAREGQDIKVIYDQTLTPTETADLAEKLAQMIRSERHGLYHITKPGVCSWYQFAAMTFELSGLQPRLYPTATATLGVPASRPICSVLAHEALVATGLEDMRPWPEALAAVLAERQTGQIS